MTMITIYEIGPDGVWTGEAAQIGEHAGAPLGWTRSAPPALEDGAVAVWTGDGWTAARPPSSDLEALETARAARLAQVRELRRGMEVAGINIDGLQVRTDATSQAKIAGVLQLMASDLDLAGIDFEVQPGQWVTLDRNTMSAIGVAVGRHVQACFSRARELQQAIEAAPDIAALEAIVWVSGWPGRGAVAMT